MKSDENIYGSYSVDSLLNLSFAAHRQNDGYYNVKKTPSIPYSNKELILLTITLQNPSPDFTPLETIQEDIENAVLAKIHFKKFIIKMIDGNLSTFQNNLYNLLHVSTTVPLHQLGLLSYVPHYFFKETGRKKSIALIRDICKNSVHYDYNMLVKGNCKILKVFANKALGYCVYTGAVDGNMVSFSSAKKFHEGATYALRGRVKFKDYDVDTGLPRTRLNYVTLK